MSYHTAVVVILCSLIGLAAWIAWLWRPPGRVARKLRPIREWAQHSPLWEHSSTTVKSEGFSDPPDPQSEPQPDETQRMPTVPPEGFPLPERRA